MMDGSLIFGRKIRVSMAKYKLRQSFWRRINTPFQRNDKEVADKKSYISLIEGVVDEDKILENCLVCWCRNFVSISNFARQMHEKCLKGFSLMRATGNVVLMCFESSMLLNRMKVENSESLAVWFDRIESWSKYLIGESRRIWLVCAGISFHAWSMDTFSNIASKWGEIIAIDEKSQYPSSFDRVKIQIFYNIISRIDEVVRLKFEDQSFNIVVHEIDPSFKPIPWVPEEDEENTIAHDNEESKNPMSITATLAISNTQIEAPHKGQIGKEVVPGGGNNGGEKCLASRPCSVLEPLLPCALNQSDQSVDVSHALEVGLSCGVIGDFNRLQGKDLRKGSKCGKIK